MTTMHTMFTTITVADAEAVEHNDRDEKLKLAGLNSSSYTLLHEQSWLACVIVSGLKPTLGFILGIWESEKLLLSKRDP